MRPVPAEADPPSQGDLVLQRAIGRARAGDTSDLAVLLLGPVRPLLEAACRGSVVCRADLDEAVSEACERILRDIGSLMDASKFNSWAWRIAKRSAWSISSKSKEAIGYSTDPSDLPEVGSEDEVDLTLARGIILGALDQLARTHPLEVETLALFYTRGMSYAEISVYQGIKPSSVGVRLHRGRKRLESLLTRAEHV